MKKDEIIETGKIKKYKEDTTYTEIDYSMRILVKNDVDHIMRLQDICINYSPDKQLIEPIDREFANKYIEGNGFTIGIFDKETLIAYGMMVFPYLNEENLGYDIHIPQDELRYVSHMDNFFVHMDYRNNSLMLKIINILVKESEKAGFYHICATVSPYNYPSLNSFFKSGNVYIVALKQKYDGKLRYIVYRNLKKELSVKPDTNIILNNTAISEQQDIIKRGYIGYKTEKLPSSNSFNVVYGELSNS